MAMATSKLKSLLPDTLQENRRDFLVGSLAVGFALAVRPIGAQTIKTDANSLTAGEVKIPVGNIQIPGYRASPTHGGGFPTVLVVHEVFGVHEHIKDICRRFAKAGYCAVAPELFARQGDVSKMTDEQQITDTVVSKVPDSQVMGDLDATAVWAVRNSRADSNRLAITGFGWGGRIVWLYAAHNPELKSGAAWYGRLEGAKNAMTPRNPLDDAGGLLAPVIGFYAGKDPGIPIESIERMQTALKVVDAPSGIIVYPEAEHGFNADYRTGYNKEAAQDAWQKQMVWFKRLGA